MQHDNDILREHAYFIAGRRAKERALNDPRIESAITDAIRYLDSLPDDLDDPLISGATTVSRENIIVLSWILNIDEEMQAVTLNFLGNGVCHVSLPDEVGHSKTTRLRTRDLADLDIPALIHEYRDGRDLQQGPRL